MFIPKHPPSILESIPYTELYDHAQKILPHDIHFFDEMFDSNHRFDREEIIIQRSKRIINAFNSPNASLLCSQIDDYYSLPPAEVVPHTFSTNPPQVLAFLRWFDLLIARHGLNGPRTIQVAFMRYLFSEYDRITVARLFLDEYGGGLPWIEVLKKFWVYFRLAAWKRKFPRSAMEDFIDERKSVAISTSEELDRYERDFEFANSRLHKPFEDKPPADPARVRRSEMEKSRVFFNGLHPELASRIRRGYRRAHGSATFAPPVEETVRLARLLVPTSELPADLHSLKQLIHRESNHSISHFLPPSSDQDVRVSAAIGSSTTSSSLRNSSSRSALLSAPLDATAQDNGSPLPSSNSLSPTVFDPQAGPVDTARSDDLRCACGDASCPPGVAEPLPVPAPMTSALDKRPSSGITTLIRRHLIFGLLSGLSSFATSVLGDSDVHPFSLASVGDPPLLVFTILLMIWTQIFGIPVPDLNTFPSNTLPRYRRLIPYTKVLYFCYLPLVHFATARTAFVLFRWLYPYVGPYLLVFINAAENFTL